MIRTFVLLLSIVTVLVLAGCDARSAAGLPEGSHVEGGIGVPFYAEVANVTDGSTRIHLFGTLAAYDAFIATKQVDELGHKKFIGKGRNHETLVVETLKGSAAKDDPHFTDSLVARYLSRLPMPAAAAN